MHFRIGSVNESLRIPATIILASSGSGNDSIRQMTFANGFPPILTFSMWRETIGLSEKKNSITVSLNLNGFGTGFYFSFADA